MTPEQTLFFYALKTKMLKTAIAVLLVTILIIIGVQRTRSRRYKAVGAGFCNDGFMRNAKVNGKMVGDDQYHRVAPFNQSLAACQELCSANDACNYISYNDKSSCALYSGGSCNRTARVGDMSYQKM